MVQDMCTQAEIPGHKTNHSLWATTATRLYHAGIDEQLIMERTGHHSIDRVRSYKQTNEEQLAILSDILNVPSKQISIASQSTQQQHDDHRAACFDLKGCTNCTITLTMEACRQVAMYTLYMYTSTHSWQLHLFNH